MKKKQNTTTSGSEYDATLLLCQHFVITKPIRMNEAENMCKYLIMKSEIQIDHMKTFW